VRSGGFLAKLLDTYQQWEVDGVLENKLKVIQEMVEKRIPQKVVAETIGLSERTLIKLRRDHPRLAQAFIEGKQVMKTQLIDALLQRALGFEYEELQTIIEETKTGTKKRLVKNKRRALPDISAIRYLLIVQFGREYNERKDEIDLMQKRLDRGEEEWTNEYSDEEDFGVIRVRKQSKK
jgi:hypothetical protein